MTIKATCDLLAVVIFQSHLVCYNLLPQGRLRYAKKHAPDSATPESSSWISVFQANRHTATESHLDSRRWTKHGRLI